MAESGEDYVAPTAANVRNDRYPLSRYLYIYINKAPNQPLEPLTAAFLDRVLSTAGQSLVNHDGYLPLPPAALQKTRQALICSRSRRPRCNKRQKRRNFRLFHGKTEL